MAFEVRICARCGKEESTATTVSGGLFTIRHSWFDGLRYEICENCRDCIANFIRSEMRYSMAKPESIIEKEGNPAVPEAQRVPELGDMVLYRVEAGDRAAVISRIIDGVADLTVFGVFSSSVIQERHQGPEIGQWRFR